MSRKIINVVYKVDDSDLKKAKTSVEGVEKETKDATQEMYKLDKATKQAGTTGQQSFGQFGTILKAIGWAALGAQIFSVGKKIFELGVKQEQVNIAFTTFLGSATKAKKLLAELNNYAIVTPFTVDQINGAAKALLAFGVKGNEIMPILKMLGDVSSGTGKDLTELAIIFGQIRSTGRLMGQDLLQLINAGFNPLQVISEKTGKSMRQLKDDMENGAISFQMVSDAFKSATSEGGLFYEMTIKQGQSIGGLMSTIGGNIDEGLKNIYTATSGPLKAFVDQLLKLSEAWIDFTKSKDQLREEGAAAAIEEATAGYKTYYDMLINGANLEKDANGAIINNAKNREAQAKASATAKEYEIAAIDRKIRKLQEEEAAQFRIKAENNTKDPLTLQLNVDQERLIKEADDQIQIIRAKIYALKDGAIPAINEYIIEEENAAKATKETGDAAVLTAAQVEAAAKKRAEALKKISKAMGFSSAVEKVAEKDETADKKHKIDTENAKRSSDLQQYFRDLRKRKEEEAEEESIKLTEEAAAKKIQIAEDEEANKQAARQRSIELGIQAGAMALELIFTQAEVETGAINEKYSKQLKAAGDNERAKADIEKRREKELALAEKKNKQIRKKNAIIRIGIDTAIAVAKSFAEFGPVAGVVPAALMAAMGALQVAAVLKFKKGKVNIMGPGTGTSDSIPAMISRGESVINASATSKSKNLLEAINSRKLDDRVLMKVSAGGGGKGADFDDSRIVAAINKNKIDYVQHGYTLMKATEQGGNFKRIIRAKIQGY